MIAAAILADGGARGAPVGDLVPATVVAIGAAWVVAMVARAYRAGRLPAANRFVAGVERRFEAPAYLALPELLATSSLGAAVFGFYWDVSWHIDRGRDPGPFANPAHWLIIVGLAGIALAGVIAVVIGVERPTRTSVRISDRWHAPVGGVLLAVCGLVALAGFPLDDVWHRLFGQDVTLWGPTHIQMVGGASLATLALWVLAVEARRDRPERPQTVFGRLMEQRQALIAGSFLVGLSTLQGEFDFGVPQFRLLYHPVLIMLAASIALTAARVCGGPGSAVRAALAFLGLRIILAVLIGPVLGRSVLHFPLYLPAAFLVELVARFARPTRQVTFGAAAGALVGTVGLACEWAWARAWAPLPWPGSLLPAAAVLGLAAALAGGVIGGLIGRSLAPSDAPRQVTPRGVAAAAWAVAFLCLAIPLRTTAPPVRAAMTTVVAGSSDNVTLTVRLDPPDAADRADWFNVTAWQGARHGDGGLVIAPLHKTADGVWRTSRAFPVGGTWKATLRLHRGRALEAVPVSLPADPAIPAAAVPLRPSVTRAFVADKRILQREALGGREGLQRVGYSVLALIGAAWILTLGWGLRRLVPAARPPARPTVARPAAAA